MAISNKKSQPLFLFFVLVAYVFLQFSWWTYLMVEQNNEIYQEKLEMVYMKSSSPEGITVAEKELTAKLHKRWGMIASEGSVFMLLLILGIIKTRNAFNREADLARREKNFLLSVTHELKSPIASVKLQLQTLLKHDLNRDKEKEILSNALSDTERLNNLAENILLAAKIDNRSDFMFREKLNLSEFIGDIITKARQSFNYTHQIALNLEPGIYFDIDRMTFPSIVMNLVENAVKYSPDGSTITIGLHQASNKIYFSVMDEGVGIDKNEKDSIFEKFYRIGNEETRKTKGTGLGLYIVNYLVNYHRGKILVKDNHPKGTEFEIAFTNM